MVKQGNIISRGLLLMLICTGGLVAPFGCREKRMSESEAVAAFKKYILSPIPASVTNIRTDQPKKIRGYRYTFRFNINRNDLALIINSGPFVRVWNVSYKHGDLWWNWDRGEGPLGISKYTSTAICYDHTSEPDWFKPGQWQDPEVYAFWKEGDLVNTEQFGKKTSGPTNIQILLYNEKETEAYFVVQYWEK